MCNVSKYAVGQLAAVAQVLRHTLAWPHSIVFIEGEHADAYPTMLGKDAFWSLSASGLSCSAARFRTVYLEMLSAYNTSTAIICV